MIRTVAIGFFVLLTGSVFGQSISGKVTLEDGTGLVSVRVFLEGKGKEVLTDSKGEYRLSNLSVGTYRVIAFLPGFATKYSDVTLGEADLVINFQLEELHQELAEVIVEDVRPEEAGIGWLQSVSGTAIYEAKKSEVIQLDQIIGNKAANVSRQVYAQVPGLNIWENDGAGLQLGIGGRGLSPNRTSNFNTRQNGYDISADALGYPESYYTPPVQALDRIEIVRGAAGLQYGTQFGGMLNFVFKEAPKEKPVLLESYQTGGSFGLFSSFNRLAGTVGRFSYNTFYQYKRSDGWRPNSDLEQHLAFGSFAYSFAPFLSVKVEHTHMTYLAQQPGGLTDYQFYENPRQSNRERNWFQVGWDLTAMEWNYRPSAAIKFNNRTFHLSANRYAVGNLGRIDRPDDPNQNRNLLKDNYQNVGNELRAVIHYPVAGEKSVLVVGNRLYFGKTLRAQGLANASGNASFRFLNPQEPEDSAFEFPSGNLAFFAENIFNLGQYWSVTPGIRYEYIRTEAAGYYFDTRTDLAGNVILNEKVEEVKMRSRDLLLAGIGVSYKRRPSVEFYANFSQNYRSINFNDIRVDNPSLTVDEQIGDERGFNFDLGTRGGEKQTFRYDVSLFYLSYQDRIGNVLKTEPDPRYNNLVPRTFQYRTNLSNAGIVGLEAYAEANLMHVLGWKADRIKWTTFVNLALIKSRYLGNTSEQIEGNEVELVPRINLKVGTTISYRNFGLSLLSSFVSSQYSDAGNTDSNPPVPGAVEGKIPSYFVMDLSLSYKQDRWSIETGTNNLTNTSYFTRRASGYPGPGIIPSDARSFYLTLGVRF